MTGHRLSHLIWQAAGRPQTPDLRAAPEGARCAQCLAPVTYGVPLLDTASSLFTAWDVATRMRGEPWLCPACHYVTVDHRDAAGRLVRLRSYSHLVVGTNWRQFSTKGRHVAHAVLAEPPLLKPWALCLVVSSKRNYICQTPVNQGPGPWVVVIDGRTVMATPHTYRKVYDAVTQLRALGCTRKEICTGAYNASRLAKLVTQAAFHEADQVVKPYRGGPLVDLVTFLASAKEADND